MRVGKNRTLCLDLPYREMGALRVVLKGKQVGHLRKRVSHVRDFPTNGGRKTDGDTSRTMKDLLGGVTYLGTDTRFSPVAVAVEGNMTLTGTQRFYAKWTRGRHSRGPYPMGYHPMLPFGGYLYELNIIKVHWSLSRRQWKNFEKNKLEPQIRKASAYLAKARVRHFHRELAAYVMLLKSRFGPVAEQFLDYTIGRKLLVESAKRLKSLPARIDPATAAKFCEVLQNEVESFPAHVPQALEKCAAVGEKDPILKTIRRRK